MTDVFKIRKKVGAILIARSSKNLQKNSKNKIFTYLKDEFIKIKFIG